LSGNEFVDIYNDMTNKQLSISKIFNNGGVNEAAISVQDETNKIMVVMRDILKGMSSRIRDMNQRAPVSGGEVVKYVREVNDTIKKRLVDTGISPCGIEFGALNGTMVGGYNPKDKVVYLNVTYYLIEPHFGGSGYILINYKDIKFNNMSSTIEHELIHHQQNERSKGKVFNSSNEKKKLSSIYGDIVNKKSEIAPNMSDDQFIENVKYYNDPTELNTFAKDVVNQYVVNVMKDMKSFIRHGGLPKRNYSADEVRSFVLSPLMRSKSDIFNVTNEQIYNQSSYNINRFKQRLIKSYDGYKYLSASSKKKWWTYVYQLLMNMKFDPLIVAK
jgi:hypothetical protein